ncbi:MAG TPA: hypothetical protein VHU61_16525 [Solirubrobacteraceae bacterium]|nr:hypothetical protein [Solirubrobacteraceae bacterium]
MKTDARSLPLDEFEQEMLERLLRAHAERSQLASREQDGPVGGTARRFTRRAGRRARRRVVGVIAVSLLAASGAFAAVAIFGGSVSPVHLYGGKALCPAGHDVVAEVSSQLYYPANYPGHLFAEGDVRCFESAQGARQAGFRLAPAPSGDTTVGPIYFAAAPLAIRRTCQRAAAEIRAIVYCPSQLPTPWFHPLINWDCPTHDCGVPLLSLTGSFRAPDSYVGSASGAGEAMIWEASAGQQRAYPYLLFGCFSSADIVGRTRFRGHPAAWYQCPIWARSTGTMLEWHIGKQTYAISADGPAGTRRALVAFIAKHLVAVDPG